MCAYASAQNVFEWNSAKGESIVLSTCILCLNEWVHVHMNESSEMKRKQLKEKNKSESQTKVSLSNATAGE